MNPDCKRCSHRINDALEGHLCLKYGLVVGGAYHIEWPGAPVKYAYDKKDTCIPVKPKLRGAP